MLLDFVLACIVLIVASPVIGAFARVGFFDDGLLLLVALLLFVPIYREAKRTRTMMREIGDEPKDD